MPREQKSSLELMMKIFIQPQNQKTQAQEEAIKHLIERINN